MHNGVHEKAASIAQDLRIGQLSFTNTDDSISQLLGRGLADALFLQLSTDIAIIQTRLKRLRELIFHTQNQILVLPVVLKPALTIAIFTLGILDDAHVSCGNIKVTASPSISTE